MVGLFVLRRLRQVANQRRLGAAGHLPWRDWKAATHKTPRDVVCDRNPTNRGRTGAVADRPRVSRKPYLRRRPPPLPHWGDHRCSWTTCSFPELLVRATCAFPGTVAANDKRN